MRSGRKTVVTWPKVVGCLGRDETRSWALKQIRDAGITGDSFGVKTEHRQGVLEALVALEDKRSFGRE
jgi:hypothetical protein